MPKDRIADNKQNRILSLYTRLIEGEVINKAEEAERFGVSLRSVQYDLDDLRAFFSAETVSGKVEKELVYDQLLRGYCLKNVNSNMLSNSEILAVCKILLESRAFCRDDMTAILNKLVRNCTPKSKERTIHELISNELFHYIEPHHRKHFIGSLWDIGQAVSQHRVMNITYEKADGSIVERRIQPVGIMFGEFYFYITAFIDSIDKKAEFDNPDDIFPTIYRIDRIQRFEVTNEHFYVSYKDRFEEGEFRKRVQFMWGGRLRRIKFLFKGVNPEPVLDRLPTAKILERSENGYVITAEVFGDGVDMWLKCQGELIEIL